jgi:hypothetical protein
VVKYIHYTKGESAMDFDKMIEDKKSEKQACIDKMEIVKNQYLKEIANFTHQWFKEEIIRTVKNNSIRLLSMGDGKAKELKTRLNSLQENTMQLVEKHLDDDLLWWHVSGNDNKKAFYVTGNKIMSELDEGIRLVFGELVKVFIEYEIFEREADNISWIKENGIYGLQQDREWKYRYSVTYSQEIIDCNKNYVDLIKKVQFINAELHKTENKKRRENVEEWWTSL